MPGVSSIKYKKVDIVHKINSATFEKKQELKEELLLSLMDQCYEQVDFSGSIDKV